MRKFAACLVIVLVFVGTMLAYVDSAGMIGKVVDQVYPVYVNEQKWSADAIVIDGTSYIPTRAVSNALGAKVNFQNGQSQQVNTGLT